MTLSTRESAQDAQVGAALQYVMTSDIPAQHKAVLIEVLTQALRDHTTMQLREKAMLQAGTQWQTHETEQLQAFLEGKVAKGWQHADELVMHLVAQLRRSPADVRAKATELGFGASVDYRLAKARAQLAGE